MTFFPSRHNCTTWKIGLQGWFLSFSASACKHSYIHVYSFVVCMRSFILSVCPIPWYACVVRGCANASTRRGRATKNVRALKSFLFPSLLCEWTVFYLSRQTGQMYACVYICVSSPGNFKQCDAAEGVLWQTWSWQVGQNKTSAFYFYYPMTITNNFTFLIIFTFIYLFSLLCLFGILEVSTYFPEKNCGTNSAVVWGHVSNSINASTTILKWKCQRNFA